MLFTEIALQNVTGFPPGARIPLAPGYNVVVAKDVSLFSLLEVIFDGAKPGAALGMNAAPRRAALTFTGDDSHTYRLVRDLDGGQALLRQDPETKQWIRGAETAEAVSQGLRDLLGLSGLQAMSNHGWLLASQLPGRAAGAARPGSLGPASMMAKSAPVMSKGEAQQKLPQLQDELQRAELLERTQDAMNELRQRLESTSDESTVIGGLQRQIEQVTKEIHALAQSTQPLAHYEARIRKLPALKARYETTMRAMAHQKGDYEKDVPPGPPLAMLVRDPMVLGGVVGGLACVIGAIALGSAWPLAVDVLPFGLAAFGGWRWVDRTEAGESARKHLHELSENEKRTRRQFEVETNAVEGAMKAAGIESIDEILGRFQAQAELEAQRKALVADIDARRADPSLLAAEAERQSIEEDLRAHEQTISETGFTRGSGEIRNEIEMLEEVVAGHGPADPLAMALNAAAALAGAPAERLLEGFTDRLGQYAAALTDRRCAGFRFTQDGFQIVTAQGPVPFSQIASPDRDLVYVALRLGLAERVSAVVKRPFVVDDPNLLVDAAHRPLFLKMLKGVGSLTQVVVRTLEPPMPTGEHVAASRV